MRQIAVIPARSGSKGLKDKNIRDLDGKPMMAYTIEAARESGIFDCVHVSTDSEAYAEIARSFGADVPFLRSDELAGDTASSWDALRYAVRQYEKAGRAFDLVTLLQPTSPLRDAEDIRNAYGLFCEKDADAVISVCALEHSIQICGALPEDGCMQGFSDSNKIGARQAFLPHYRINGAIYMQKTRMLMQKENLYGERSYAYVMDKAHSVDVDDAFDFSVARMALRAFKEGPSGR